MTEKNPIISIVIPLYNKEKEVCRAIDSVFAQTIHDFELFIVDGGSTDGSLERIHKYEYDQRFHLIHQKSDGFAGAGRNDGILVASADIVAFLDADDEWNENFIEKILQLRKRYPNAGLYATAFVMCNNSVVKKPRLVDVPQPPWDGILPSYFRTSALAFMYPFMSSCVAIPKITFKHIGLFNPELRTGEDTEMWGKIALEFPIAFDASVGMKYYADANNKITDSPRVMEQHPFILYLETYPHKKYLDNPDYENIRLYVQKEEIGTALNNLYAGCPQVARKNLKNVYEKKFIKYKLVLVILSYLPTPVLRRVLPIANRIGRR